MIGIVAIGRNEGERLRNCLRSALRDSGHVIYVDSGSTDGSVNLAREMGATAVELDLSVPFTAARARNCGLKKLVEIAPDVEFAQFADGDCEIVEGWVKKALLKMQNNPKAAVVAGRRRERFPHATIYNALCDIEWNTPVGKARACGGDALMRVKALIEVGGYNDDIIAGEEPELCVRLRQTGWEIWRIDAEMTLHDAAMTRFSQWWKRSVRSGHAFAEGFARHGAPPERHNYKQVKSIWVLAAILPAIILIATLTLVAIAPRLSWIPAMAVLLYPLLVIKIAMNRMAAGLSPRQASLYAFFVVIGKFPQMIGMLTYRRSRRRGTRTLLIEYKSAGSNPNPEPHVGS